MTTRIWDRGELISAIVLAAAGIAWFGWAQADPPPSWVPWLAVGSGVSLVLLIALVVLLARHRTNAGSAMADSRVRRAYWMAVGVEVAAILGGNLTLAGVGHPEYDAAWTLFVVGVHFVPLGRIFHAGGLVTLGAIVAIVALASACVGLVSDLAPSATAGAGGGIAFVLYAGWVLTRGHVPAHRVDTPPATPQERP